MIGVRFHYERGPAVSARDSLHPDLWCKLCSYWSPAYGNRDPMVAGIGYVPAAGMLRTRASPLTNIIPLAAQPVGQAWNFGTGQDRSLDLSQDHRACGISGNASWTLAAWINPSSVAAAMGVIKLGNETTTLQAMSLYIAVTGSGVLSAEFAGGNGARSGTGVLTANVWQHIAATKIAGAINATTTLYLNGKIVAISTASANTPNVTFNATDRIGRFAGSGDKYGGYIGEVGVWARAMRPCEVMRLAAGASPLQKSLARERRQYVSIPLVTTTAQVGKQVKPNLFYSPSPARRSGESIHPRLWRQLKCIWSPAHSKGDVIRDYGPLGFHMTLQGNAALAPSDSGIGLYVPGDPTSYATSSRALTVGEFQDLTGNPNFSIAAWVKTSAFHTGGIVKWGDSQTVKSEACLYVNAHNSGVVSLECSSNSAFSSSVDLFKDQQWVHLALTKSAGAMNTTTTLYVNGNQVSLSASSSTNTPTITAAGNLELGRANSNFAGNGLNENFNGVIGECAIWARVLLPKEVQMLSQGKSPLQRKAKLPRWALSPLIPHRVFAHIFN